MPSGSVPTSARVSSSGLTGAGSSRSLAYARPGTGQLVGARTGVPGDMQARVVVDPVDQPVAKHGIGRDAGASARIRLRAVSGIEMSIARSPARRC